MEFGSPSRSREGLGAIGYGLLAIGKAEFGHLAGEMASGSLGEIVYIV